MSRTTMTAAFAMMTAATIAMANAQTAPTTNTSPMGKSTATEPAGRSAISANHLLPGQIRASEMNGATVYDKEKQNLGSIKDIILDRDGRVAVVVLDVLARDADPVHAVLPDRGDHDVAVLLDPGRDDVAGRVYGPRIREPRPAPVSQPARHDGVTILTARATTARRPSVRSADSLRRFTYTALPGRVVFGDLRGQLTKARVDWTPDGAELVFLATVGGQCHVHAVAATGGS